MGDEAERVDVGEAREGRRDLVDRVAAAVDRDDERAGELLARNGRDEPRIDQDDASCGCRGDRAALPSGLPEDRLAVGGQEPALLQRIPNSNLLLSAHLYLLRGDNYFCVGDQL